LCQFSIFSNLLDNFYEFYKIVEKIVFRAHHEKTHGKEVFAARLCLDAQQRKSFNVRLAVNAW
jgi:hypothetical protein